MLPLYIGIGVVLVGGVTAAVLVLRSRGDDGRTYRRRRKLTTPKDEMTERTL